MVNIFYLINLQERKRERDFGSETYTFFLVSKTVLKHNDF